MDGTVNNGVISLDGGTNTPILTSNAAKTGFVRAVALAVNPASCLAVAAGLPARAGTITIDFSQPVFTVLPGQTNVAAFATLTNTDPLNPAFLNGDNISVPGGTIVTDEFFANVPFLLDPGQTSPLLELFHFDVAPDAAGTLSGTYQVLGGVGTANSFNFDPVASQAFSIRVATLPEPSLNLLVGAALLGISLVGRKKVRRRQKAVRMPFQILCVTLAVFSLQPVSRASSLLVSYTSTAGCWARHRLVCRRCWHSIP